MKRIVYQGVSGSNNEVAAFEFSKQNNYKNVHYIEGTSSRGVVECLQRGEADFGVVATYNNLVGDVGETTLALSGVEYKVLNSTKLHIHHALFTKNANCAIKKIASHPHALGQCAHYIEDNYPTAQLLEISDTAIGARHLSDGTLSDSTGILCRKNAGDTFNLHLVSENVADTLDNFTTFILLELI